MATSTKGTLIREYRQLTDEDRIEIYAMKQAGKQQNKIAADLGVYPSTVSRELIRNTGLRGYRPKQAHQKALHRRFTARKAVKMTPETISHIENKLADEYSPNLNVNYHKGNTTIIIQQVQNTFGCGYAAPSSCGKSSSSNRNDKITVATF